MPRSRRWIRSKRMHELSFRAREGLPMPALRVIKVILESAIARTQRDDKLKLCGGVGMGNHPHLFSVSKEGVDVKRFYEELKKKITDAVKRLLGLEHLSIWEEGDTEVAEIQDLDNAKSRIVYFFLNPATANLVDSIDNYPGLSSWKIFQENLGKLHGVFEKEVPWIRLPSIPKLPSAQLTENQDKHFAEEMVKANKKKHKLVIFPNAWMEVFGVTTDEEALEINTEILSRVREGEESLRQERKLSGRHPMGAHKLKNEPILKPHKPKKKERRIFMLSSKKELRIAFLEEYRAFCDKCRECYEAWKKGDWTLIWPAGAFRPPAPPIANALCCFE